MMPPEIRWQMLDCFPDDLKIADARVLGLAVSQELLVCHP